MAPMMGGEDRDNVIAEKVNYGGCSRNLMKGPGEAGVVIQEDIFCKTVQMRFFLRNGFEIGKNPNQYFT